MELVSPILDIGRCLWQSASTRAAFLLHLEKNSDSLEIAIDQLKNLRDDVITRVEEQEDKQQMERTKRVSDWLAKVEQMEAQVTKVLQQGKEVVGKKCLLFCCPRNCRASYKLGKKVSKMIGEVDKLKKPGDFDVLAYRLPRAPVDEMPMEKTVGLDSMFEKVWRSIEDKSSGIIGLYGLGGVGKTTLLKKINNQFSNTTHDFDVVIWVAVSKQINVENIQEVIRNKLEIGNSIWINRSDELERAIEIYRVLRRKKFVLLLDDVWERLDLSKVGVPFPGNNNESRVIFTTRSEEVCGYMEADRRFRVECLAEQDALNLFQKMVGEDTLSSHQEIPQLAQIVAKKCQGLPLALITTGRAMASRKKPQEWKYAMKALQSYPSKFSGMEDHVFPILKFSYDSLNDETVKTCFLYCSLFPEDHIILKEELINLWIGEGFLDKFDDIHDARIEGEYIIGSLKLAGLLEGDELEEHLGVSTECVWLHDVIRDMALWLACEHGKETKILVRDQPGRINLDQNQVKEVEKISMWSHHVNVIEGFLIFPNLQTLILRNSRLISIPSEVILCVPGLKVLDLSSNHGLAELPEGIGKLINLHYLNLSWTAIKEMSTEIKKLTKLRCLVLDNTKYLQLIAKEVISSLISLQRFSKLATIDFLYNEFLNEVALLDELQSLKNLNDLSINLSTSDSVEKFFNSPILQGCIRELTLVECSEMTSLDISLSSMTRMKHLEKLELRFCQSISELRVRPCLIRKANPSFSSLRFLHIGLCPIRDLTWLIYAPKLETLELVNCDSVNEVINANCGNVKVEADHNIFSNLTKLYLVKLPNLHCIFHRALSFPSLEKMHVSECPKLRKLPFDSNSNNTLNVIKGERSWWDGLQWDNEGLKDLLSSKFVEEYYTITDSLISYLREELPMLFSD
ncbi:disease resistance protein SUMM2 [Ricinus communis]|uniref:disease resistance protein SUMM2 n=1 Tax=Ricinus communis TaxID=3988 RepID=UPI0007724299|nr:disease resistance protein SUMM2 [Ricinus communis]|eukprot:XP_015573825.1 disease resistance protein SUMM2 [Ricinus communis]